MWSAGALPPRDALIGEAHETMPGNGGHVAESADRWSDTEGPVLFGSGAQTALVASLTGRICWGITLCSLLGETRNRETGCCDQVPRARAPNFLVAGGRSPLYGFQVSAPVGSYAVRMFFFLCGREGAEPG